MKLPVVKPAERYRRGHATRAMTITERTSKKQLKLLDLPQLEEDFESGRPRTRGECKYGRRPCPYVSCKHHLYLDVTIAGSIKINFPDIDVTEMSVSCSLDVADLGGLPLETVGRILNLTRERIRQTEVNALRHIEPRVKHLREKDD